MTMAYETKAGAKAYEKSPDEIGALWAKTSAKGEYLSGEINGVRVVCFRAQKKSEKSPDWRVLKAQPRAEGQRHVVTDEEPPF